MEQLCSLICADLQAHRHPRNPSEAASQHRNQRWIFFSGAHDSERCFVPTALKRTDASAFSFCPRMSMMIPSPNVGWMTSSPTLKPCSLGWGTPKDPARPAFNAASIARSRNSEVGRCGDWRSARGRKLARLESIPESTLPSRSTEIFRNLIEKS